MIYTKLIKKAMKIAYEAHINQFDRAGVPYIYHPIHLAEQTDTEIECIVALLHDVVEDSNITFSDLEKEFPLEVIDLLKLLTRDKNDSYMEYIKKLKENEITRRIKILDILHNSDESRLDKIRVKDIIRRNKYRKALKYLRSE